MKLELEIYFEDVTTMLTKILEMAKEIENGVMSYNDVNCRYQVLITKEPKFRYEEHDGVLYAVFESKMNNEETHIKQ